MIVLFLGKSAALADGVLFLVFKFFVAQGLIEEALFRGLIYRHLRVGRSFWRASVLSGILFAFVHLANLAKGFSPEILMALGVSISFGFLLTFPLALLFELGSGSILAGAVFHFAVDSINCFRDLGEPGASLFTYMGFLVLAGVLVVVVGIQKLKF